MFLEVSQKVLQHLRDKNLPKLNNDQCTLCEKDTTKEEVKHELNKIEINKSPGNDGLTKYFYEAFGDHVKVPLLLLLKMTFLKEKLSTSQKQAVIKLIKKKDRDKRFIKNWRPISLLNVDVKLISKVLSNRIKNLLPNLISNNQNACVANRFIICEGERIISDNLEMRDILNMEDYLLTKDIEKAFDSVDHCFLLAILEKYGLRKTF